VTEDTITASYENIVNAVKMYKRLSAHMEEVTYQARIYCTIYTNTDYWLYKTPMTGKRITGTYPQRNRKGRQFENRFVVGTEKAGFIFNVPAAATQPERNTIFRNSDTQIDAITGLNAFKYRNTPTGKINAGETPQRNYKGQQASGGIKLQDMAEGFAFSVPAAGTQTERNVIFKETDMQIDAETALEMFRHMETLTGETNAGKVPIRSYGGQSIAEEVKNSVETAGFLHKSKLCGNSRKL
jgi:hypothetical protein